MYETESFLRSQSVIEGLLFFTSTSVATIAAIHSIDWKNSLIRVVMLASGYGAFFVLQRKLCPDKKDHGACTHWPVQVLDNSRTTVDNSEVCPICLEPPRDGLRTGCGHNLCARCLRSYCEINKRNRPPKCPLCRTPLVSVTLTYHQSECRSDNVDTETSEWIDKFNETAGCLVEKKSVFFFSKSMIFVKLLLVSIFFASLSKFQILSGVDMIAYSSFFVMVFGMILMTCIWLKSQDQDVFEDDD